MIHGNIRMNRLGSVMKTNCPEFGGHHVRRSQDLGGSTGYQGPEFQEFRPKENLQTRCDPGSLLYDWVLPLIAVVCLVASCLLVSPKKELWVDEGYSLRVLTDKSLYHAMYAITRGVDGGMPLYYLVAYLWAKVFGTSLLALRLFSCFGICAGAVVLWKTMSGIYSRVGVAVGVLSAVITSTLVLTQNVEIRYYGLFFASAAIVLAAHRRLVQQAAGSKPVLPAIVAHGALVMSHPLGVLYSGVAILALLASDRRNHALRPGLYAGLCASWLTILVWIRPILHIYDIGRPHNWLVPPGLSEIINFFSISPFVPISILVSVCLAAVSTQARYDDERESSSGAMTLHAVGYVLVPIVVAITSWLLSPLFCDRYFLPSTLGAAIIVAHVVDSVLPGKRLVFSQRLGASVLILVMLIWPIWTSWRMPRDENFERLDRKLAIGVPVIVEDGNFFIPLSYYTQQRPSPYYYVLDWDTAWDSPSRHATVQYKLMRNAKAAGYAKNRIIESRDALCGFDRFIVLDTPSISWFEERVLLSRNFHVENIGHLGYPEPGPSNIWMVTRRYRSADCGTSSGTGN